ncbi:MAG: hypothetical protein GC134_03310 [Proteobacteria bacterium]|nr:hypothetical protein [Pseudomonadota bacterium]
MTSFPELVTDEFRLRQLLHDMFKSGELADPDRLADAREAIRYITLHAVPETDSDSFEQFGATSWIEAHTKLWMRYLTLFDARRRGVLSAADEADIYISLLWTEVQAINGKALYPTTFKVAKP